MDKNTPTQIATMLDDYKPGYLPEPLFISIARLAVLTAIEFIPLRKGQGDTIEVLVFERPATDPIWPSMLHTPGTILLATDNSFEDGFKRLFNDELATDELIVPIFSGINMIHHKRGAGVTIEYILNINKEYNGGKFYDVQDLPANFIVEQIDLVRRAAEKFKSL